MPTIQAAFEPLVPVRDPSTFPIASPWSSSELADLVFKDVFGFDAPIPNSREAAMRLDAVARCRNLLCTTISRMPLRAASAPAGAWLTGTEDYLLPPDQQPTWLYRTDGGMGPRQRIVWTVDDLMFHGWSLWLKKRAAESSGGWPLNADRVPWGSWYVDADLRVCVNGSPLSDQNDALLIQGFHEGILSYGRDVMADAKRLYQIVRDRLANPVPMVELHQIDGAELTATERDELVDHWRTARAKEGGSAVGFTNKHIELKTHGAEQESSLLIEGRNAAAVSIARMIGVAAGRIDATTPKASLNYETRTGRNQELVDFDLDLYLGPIEERLSLDDCVPRGTYVVFDRGDTTAPQPSPTGPALQD